MATSLKESIVQSRARSKDTLCRAQATVRGEKSFAGESISGGGQDIRSIFGDQSESQYGVFRSHVYACINAICSRVAGQPIRVGRQEGASANPERMGKPSSLKAAQYRAAMPAFVKSSGQELEVLEDHELLDLLAKPNPIQRKRELLIVFIANLYLTGEAYLLREGDPDKDDDIRVWAIPTSWVQPVHKDGLFTSYRIRFNDNVTPIDVPAEVISRTYFPDPANLKVALAPVKAIMTPIRTDDHIQTSQEKMFENGMFPRIALKAGGFPSPDGTSAGDRKAVLTASQRKQLTLTIRKLWSGVSNYGEPPILDGIIDDIVKLSSTPEEMDWLNSGMQIKDRIFQAFGVNPIVLGATTPSNKAQAVEAEKNFCNQTINPLIGSISESLTEFLGPVFEPESRLKIWIEECHPIDEDLRLKKWDVARKNDDVTRNEYRSQILGLPPDEDETFRAKVLSNPTTIGSIANIIQQVNVGSMTPDQGTALLVLSLQIEEDEARKLVEGGKQTPLEDELASYLQTPKMATKLTRLSIKAISLLQQGTAEKRVINAAQRVISKQIRSIVAELRSMKSYKNGYRYDRKNSEQSANAIMDNIFRPADWTEPMVAEFAPVVGRMITEGALAEIEIHHIVLDDSKAIDFEAIGLDLNDLPAGVTPSLPDWIIDVAREETEKIFAQPYWLKIPVTTRNNVFTLVNKGIADGQSIRDMANEIMERFGDTYTKARAVAVARTETSAALNAGHAAGIKHVEVETGIVTGKEWLSVLGTTTRDDHAEIDGTQVRTADGLFNLGGTEVPYPSHFALPAGQRINCQCTIISTLIADGLE